MAPLAYKLVSGVIVKHLEVFVLFSIFMNVAFAKKEKKTKTKNSSFYVVLASYKQHNAQIPLSDEKTPYLNLYNVCFITQLRKIPHCSAFPAHISI